MEDYSSTKIILKNKTPYINRRSIYIIIDML